MFFSLVPLLQYNGYVSYCAVLESITSVLTNLCVASKRIFWLLARLTLNKGKSYFTSRLCLSDVQLMVFGIYRRPVPSLPMVNGVMEEGVHHHRAPAFTSSKDSERPESVASDVASVSDGQF